MNWLIGELIADLGTESATEAGHKTFDATQEINLEKGWYFIAIASIGESIKLRNCKLATPGLLQYSLTGSGLDANFITTWMEYYLYTNIDPAIVTDGFQPVWQGNPITDRGSADDTFFYFPCQYGSGGINGRANYPGTAGLY